MSSEERRQFSFPCAVLFVCIAVILSHTRVAYKAHLKLRSTRNATLHRQGGRCKLQDRGCEALLGIIIGNKVHKIWYMKDWSKKVHPEALKD
jgi:hypothetical protein